MPVLLRHKVAAHDVPPILTRPLTSEIEPKFANTATRDWAVEGRFDGDTCVTKLSLQPDIMLLPVQSASRPKTTRTLQQATATYRDMILNRLNMRWKLPQL